MPAKIATWKSLLLMCSPQAIAARDAVKAIEPDRAGGTQHRRPALSARPCATSSAQAALARSSTSNRNGTPTKAAALQARGRRADARDVDGRKPEWKQWLLWKKIKTSRRRYGLESVAPGQASPPLRSPRIPEFPLYKDFSSGIFDQWLSHGCDLVHLWTDETYPASVMATGGVFYLEG